MDQTAGHATNLQGQAGYVQSASIVASSDSNYITQMSSAFSESVVLDLTSIDNVGQVSPHYIDNENYNKAKRKLADKLVSILHLYGIPSSGKSEIARKLACDFSADPQTIIIKWHIQCSDNNHDIKLQLKKLLENIDKHDMLKVSKGVTETALENLQNNKCKEFVNLLVATPFPILLIVEDPRPSDKTLLNDFLSCVTVVKGRYKKLHICITSNFKSTCNLPISDCFDEENIDGLDQEEGLKLLGVTESYSHDERLAAAKIIKMLSGSPLGLLAVKASKMSGFVEYLEELEKDDLTYIIAREEKKIEQRHVYRSILILLKPKIGDEEAQNCWDAICSISCFHHGNIPQILVSRVMHYLRENTDDLDACGLYNKAESTDFIAQLTNCGMCKASGNRENVTFHQVVFIAVRLHLQEMKLLQPAMDTSTKALASVVHKDIRRPENHNFMREMVPHMYSVLKSEDDYQSSDFLIQLCQSHLHEVIGIVLGPQQNLGDGMSKAEENLTKSLTILFGIVSVLNGNTIGVERVTDPVGKDLIATRTKNIVDQFVNAGRKMRGSTFNIDDFISIILKPQQNEMDHYSSESNPTVVSYFKKALKNQVPLHPSAISSYRTTNVALFLEETLLYLTYLLEKVVSVLHTMGRLILYHDGKLSVKQREKFHWFSTIGIAICEEVKFKFGIAPIFLRLTTSSVASIRLKGLQDIPVIQKLAILKDLKQFIKEKLMDPETYGTLFYEHGISKRVTVREFDALAYIRSVVRINARLIALGVNDGDDFDMNEADTLCWRFYTTARSNMEWEISHKCLVYCGKYWAAKEDYKKAIEIIEEALESDGVKSGAERTRSFPWACYNHTRAVVCGNILNHAFWSKQKCEKALEQRVGISKDLVKKLDESVKKLDEMLSVTKAKVVA